MHIILTWNNNFKNPKFKDLSFKNVKDYFNKLLSSFMKLLTNSRKIYLIEKLNEF